MEHFRVEVPLPSPQLLKLNRMSGYMPEFLRKWLIVKKNKPVARPKDVYDVLHKDPYTINEIEENKIYQIRYEQEDRFTFTNMISTLCGKELTSYEVIEAIREQAKLKNDEEWAHLIEEDIKKLQDAKANPQAESVNSGTMIQNTIVVKLNSGDVLIYNPCHVHPESSLSKLIDKLGTVKWLILSGSEHTLQLPSVIKSFPDAAVVGSTEAELKLQAVSALPRKVLDYNVSIVDGNSRSLSELCKNLEFGGAKVWYIRGDCGTHSTLLQFDDFLLENDILYLHHDTCSCCQCAGTVAGFKDPVHWNRRILASLYASKMMSNQEYRLPYYRFWMMDRNMFGNLMLDRPSVDAISRSTMADSLRKVLGLDFQHVLCVHHYGVISANDFKRSVNRSWRWLDGKSLRDE